MIEPTQHCRSILVQNNLFWKSAILDLTSYLLLRGSEQYNLQQVADKSIEAGGSASAAMSDNGMVINIQANKDQFNDFFQFIIEMMKSRRLNNHNLI